MAASVGVPFAISLNGQDRTSPPHTFIYLVFGSDGQAVDAVPPPSPPSPPVSLDGTTTGPPDGGYYYPTNAPTTAGTGLVVRARLRLTGSAACSHAHVPRPPHHL